MSLPLGTETDGLMLACLAIVMAIVIVGALYLSIRVIAHSIYRAQLAKCETQLRDNEDRLKSLMIQRGMSADEIERVLRATDGRPSVGATAPADAETTMVQTLSENGYEAADIERIMTAARRGEAIPPSAGKLVTTLAENWASADDIVRLVKARSQKTAADCASC